LGALGTLQRLRDGLGRSSAAPAALEAARPAGSEEEAESSLQETTSDAEAETEEFKTEAEADRPRRRYNKQVLDERLAATR
jgi:uncharacterized membrane protein YqiK